MNHMPGIKNFAMSSSILNAISRAKLTQVILLETKNNMTHGNDEKASRFFFRKGGAGPQPLHQNDAHNLLAEKGRAEPER